MRTGALWLLLLQLSFLLRYISAENDRSSIEASYEVFSDEVVRNEVPDLCQSPIYCQGELLKTIQLAAIYRDSKTFVGLYQKQDQNITLANFEKLMEKTERKPSKVEIKQFIDDNFDDKDELYNATLKDWRANPSLMRRIRDPVYRQWVSDLNYIWKALARHMTSDVKKFPDRYSLIYVDNTFIIPGGRFKEFYYWDSFWVIEGLLLCDMHDTTRGLIENFLSMVSTYGFVPNGGRIYYLMRSQPPLLIPMMDKYYEVTKDWDFVDRNLAILEKEFSYWQNYKTVTVHKNGLQYKMARYVCQSAGPRPESFREDYILAENISDPVKRQAFYNNVKAGAETGWDFSARWFVDAKGEPSLDLADITTEDIIPVDLNSFLEQNARTLARYNRKKNNFKKMKYYTSVAKEYRRGIDEVLWNEVDGIWYDWDTKHHKPRRLFYATNLTPLYTLSYNPAKALLYGKKATNYLQAKGIENFEGGVPASLDNSSQQWDYPNAWPPLQSIIVQGLRQTNYMPAQDLAKELAKTWLQSNYLGFSQTKKMFEKYDATQPGKFGGGGEYEVQEGFGWTNGVVLEFLDTYPWIAYDLDFLHDRSTYSNSEGIQPRMGVDIKKPTNVSRPVLKSIWTTYF
nr:trehalase [Trichogramma dendrolimi]